MSARSFADQTAYEYRRGGQYMPEQWFELITLIEQFARVCKEKKDG